MSADLIIRHWENELLVFQKNLQALKRKPDQDAMHQFRVAIKKLRSYLKLYSHIVEKNDKDKLMAQTNTVFSIIGKYRDLQMNLELLADFEQKNKTSYEPLSSHFKGLENYSSQQMQKALRKYDGYELKIITTHIYRLSDINPALLERKVKQACIDHLENSNNRLKNLSRDAHPIRKSLKDFFYWQKIVPVSFFPGLKMKKFEKILDELGRWQDYKVIYMKIKHYRKDYIAKHTGEEQALKDLEKEIKTENEDQLKKVKKDLSNFLDPLFSKVI